MESSSCVEEGWRKSLPPSLFLSQRQTCSPQIQMDRSANWKPHLVHPDRTWPPTGRRTFRLIDSLADEFTDRLLSLLSWLIDLLKTSLPLKMETACKLKIWSDWQINQPTTSPAHASSSVCLYTEQTEEDFDWLTKCLNEWLNDWLIDHSLSG